jgi:glycine betaine/proline transport system ATP-binding protein
MTRVAEAPWPVPVVDDDGRYRGTISRASLLLTLDRSDEEPAPAAEAKEEA